MGFELSKRVLNSNQVVAVVVLLDDLLVQAMVNTSLEDVGVLVSRDLSTSALVACCVSVGLCQCLKCGCVDNK